MTGLVKPLLYILLGRQYRETAQSTYGNTGVLCSCCHLWLHTSIGPWSHRRHLLWPCDADCCGNCGQTQVQYCLLTLIEQVLLVIFMGCAAAGGCGRCTAGWHSIPSFIVTADPAVNRQVEVCCCRWDVLTFLVSFGCAMEVIGYIMRCLSSQLDPYL